MKTFKGRCHCGGVRFEITTDLAEAATCNCSICTMKNAVMHRVAAEDFRLLAGEAELTLYQFNTKTAKHYFCRTCGIYPFHRPRVAPDQYAINVNCLEGVDLEEIPVQRFDGKSFF